jgi:hypothetical protein
MSGGEWQSVDAAALAAYVSEEENPENVKGVAGVEVLVPSPLLASGMCLVDTPGIGSVSLGNTEATKAFVPHIDAALVVLGADPPISGEEVALVVEAGGHVEHLLVVLNKADRTSEAERGQAWAFAKRVLEQRLGRQIGPVHEVSATERLAGTGPQRDFPALVAELERLARESGSTLVRAAEERGLILLSRRLLRSLGEERSALLRPLEESEDLLKQLATCITDAQYSLKDLTLLLAAEQARLADQFSIQTEEFLVRAQPRAMEQFREALASLGPMQGLALRRQAYAAAQEISKELLDAWLPQARAAAEALYVQGMERFVKVANDFLDRLVATGALSLTEMPRSLGPETGFRVQSKLHYTHLWSLTTQNPLSWIIDAVRTPGSARRAVERQGSAYLQEILSTNAARIKNDFNDRVLESRRRLGAEIGALLQSVYVNAEQALARARESRAAGSQAVRDRLARIDALQIQVEALAPQEHKESTS